jgi:hypothetical protein
MNAFEGINKIFNDAIKREEEKQKMIEQPELEFDNVLNFDGFEDWTIVLQQYTEYNGEKERQIYNVAIKFDIDWQTRTLDLFETYELDEATNYYEMIVNNINKVEHTREEVDNDDDE